MSSTAFIICRADTKQYINIYIFIIPALHSYINIIKTEAGRDQIVVGKKTCNLIYYVNLRSTSGKKSQSGETVGR